MDIVVQKYGGSSLADEEALRRVARAVVARQRLGVKLVVVVSAMGRTTEQLLKKASDLVACPPQRELDMLLTAGERMAMALLTMAIMAEGAAAISLTGSQAGILTDDAHGGANIVAIESRRIKDALEKNLVVVVAGYQGVSYAKEVTTLGRGGSDTTAIALGAALGASAIEICSDVDGVFTADPTLCPQARLLAAVPYEPMYTLASLGARVLRHDAVAYAAAAGITFVARRTAGQSGRGTAVGRVARPSSGALAVAHTLKGLWATPSHLVPYHKKSFYSPDLYAALRALGGRPMMVLKQGLFIDLQGAALQAERQIHSLVAAHELEAVSAGAVCVAGYDLLERCFAQGCANLEAAGIVSLCATGLPASLVWLVSPHQVQAAVAALHPMCLDKYA